MQVDADSLAPGQELRGDVCVVGGGPAGLTTALRLAEAGLRVLLVEAGSAAPPPAGADVDTARSVGLDYPLRESRAAGLGGSALRWDIVTPLGAPFVRLQEFEELDFDARPGVGLSGWPFSKSTLVPHYRRAWELFGLQPAAPPAGSDGTVRQDSFVYGPATVFTEALPRAVREHRHVVVVGDVTVTQVRTDSRPDQVSGLDCRTRSGVAVTATASSYVLAGGGIENPRLLLASTSTHPAGLGNAHDLVGRYFQEHPHYNSAVLLTGAPSPGGRMRVRDGQAELARFLLSPELVRDEMLLLTAYYLLQRPRSSPVVRRRDGSVDVRATAAAAELRRGVLSRRRPDRVAAHLADLGRAAPAVVRVAASEVLYESRRRRQGEARRLHAYTIQAMAEQLPLASSRVRLGRPVDRHGVAVAELDWRLAPLDHASMLRSQELLGPALASALVGEVHSLIHDGEAPKLGVGYHHMCTTRMASDPRSGVVDADGLVHGTSNLYITGSSVFPTGGAANPTLTVVALADRLAAHLAGTLQRSFTA